MAKSFCNFYKENNNWEHVRTLRITMQYRLCINAFSGVDVDSSGGG